MKSLLVTPRTLSHKHLVVAKKLTEEEMVLRSISEREWQNHVCRIATLRGWRYYHPPDNRPVNGQIQKIVSGFPDLCLIKNNRMVFAELKREMGIVSAEQEEWIDAIKKCGIEVYVWRPSNLHELVAILSE
jgi:hypothetical protein